MEKDKLDIIFEMQNKFDSDLVQRRDLSGISQAEWIQKETLAMLDVYKRQAQALCSARRGF